MSTYDAYNLSLRDSTEFTVPTGGSGGDSNFTIATLTLVNTSDGDVEEPLFVVPYINEGLVECLISLIPKGESTRTLVLYDGKTKMYVMHPSQSGVLSDNITFHESSEPGTMPYYEIIGDCTITSNFGNGK